MTQLTAKTRIRRRGALLLMLAGLATVAPVTGRHAMEARADDGGSGGSGSNNSGSGDGGGSDDGGNDDGGGDDGGNDDGGSDDHGGSSSGGNGSGGNRGGAGGTGSAQGGKAGSSTQGGVSGSQRDGALAARLKGRIAPVSEVEAIAGKTVPGEIIDVRLYRNRDLYVYRVKIIQHTGSIYDVRIDAVTRKVLSARER